MNRKVFTYKATKEAQGYIGKIGLFSSSLEDIESGCGHIGTLSAVLHTDYHFEKNGGDSFQFFSPDPEPVETWVPFTEDDSSLFAGKAIRNKKDWVPGVFALIVSCTLFEVFIISPANARPEAITFRTLLDDYEFLDGTPCGKKVTQ